MIDKKTSLLVNRQLPEFVREEHPKFISFLEAYYEFLENKIGTEQNNLIEESKKLRYVSDVDASLEEFEQQFFNSFLPFIPRNTALNKETLIKNIMPLYLAKGSEKGYQLLFRMLFDEEVDVEYPGNQILRASDGRWSYEGVLATEPEIYSEYISDGERDVYYLPYVIDSENISVYINDSLVDTGYRVLKELQKIQFDIAPSLNSNIKIYYSNFDLTYLNNREFVGTISGAKAIAERTGRRNIGDINVFLFFINQNNLFGNFSNGEIVNTNIILENDFVIPFSLLTFCEVASIKIINGGSNYNVGDPVIIRGPSTKEAVAIVDDVAGGLIQNLTVTSFGAGYQIGNKIIANEYSEEYFLGSALTVDDSGFLSPNTISFTSDIVDDYSSVTISDVSYNFVAFPDANVTTTIADALTTISINNLGGITSANVTNSLIGPNTNPTIVAVAPLAFGNTRIDKLGIIGAVDIVNGGINYQKGDILEFVNTEYFGGYGATGVVVEVDENGSIIQIEITNPGLSYVKEYLPKVNVISSTGSNASLIVRYLMGTGATFGPITETGTDGVSGEILSIRVLETGSGYSSVPGIDLSRSGDGNAVAEAVIRSSFNELPGKWKTLDGLLSNDQIRLQGRDYYINYSYVLSSKVEFEKYKNILKNLIHPAGLINYAKYRIFENIDVSLQNSVKSYVNFGNVPINSDTTLITVDSDEYTADYF